MESWNLVGSAAARLHRSLMYRGRLLWDLLVLFVAHDGNSVPADCADRQSLLGVVACFLLVHQAESHVELLTGPPPMRASGKMAKTKKVPRDVHEKLELMVTAQPLKVLKKPSGGSDLFAADNQSNETRKAMLQETVGTYIIYGTVLRYGFSHGYA